MNYNELELHPLCKIFPRASAAERKRITESIKAGGLNEPIELLDGEILDGRNRYECCKAAEYEFTKDDFRTLDVATMHEGDPAAHVVIKNVARRSLKEDVSIPMLVGKVAKASEAMRRKSETVEAEAQARRAAGNAKGGASGKRGPAGSGENKSEPNSAQTKKRGPQSRDEIAALFGIKNSRDINTANRINEGGCPDVVRLATEKVWPLDVADAFVKEMPSKRAQEELLNTKRSNGRVGVNAVARLWAKNFRIRKKTAQKAKDAEKAKKRRAEGRPEGRFVYSQDLEKEIDALARKFRTAMPKKGNIAAMVAAKEWQDSRTGHIVKEARTLSAKLLEVADKIEAAKQQP